MDSALKPWRCMECQAISPSNELLREMSPFGSGDVLTGCPHCKSAECFEEVCEEKGCNRVAGCGWLPKEGEYRRTCGIHMGKHFYINKETGERFTRE
jgi:hypothetical protein